LLKISGVKGKSLWDPPYLCRDLHPATALTLWTRGPDLAGWIYMILQVTLLGWYRYLRIRAYLTYGYAQPFGEGGVVM
jgi:hypothetical protein